ncbi:galactose mutarotase-like domain-containing protein [Chytridium lagenaria]|nr:galactose mutarotase-like domain-containing protein [Chytridium lagenaria]
MPVQVGESSVVVTRGTASVEIYHYGATVTSWKVDGKEKLFLSTKAILNGSKAIRGGIPLVFPQFGTVEGSKLPQHGFARISKWKWLGTEVDNDNETVVSFGLTKDNVDPALFALWPHPFSLTYTVRLGASTLKTSLGVKNIGTEAFSFTTLLHTYFAVNDLANLKVTHLNGLKYADKVANGSFVESNEYVTIAGEVDRVYENLTSPELSIIDGSLTTKLALSGFNDVVVWNPWIEKAKAMADFNDEGYLNMVCVEAGKVSSSVQLPPSEEWIGEQTVSA